MLARCILYKNLLARCFINISGIIFDIVTKTNDRKYIFMPMKNKIIILLLLFIAQQNLLNAQTLIDDKSHLFKVSGYLRTGVGRSHNGDTQAHFQVPGALNKYSLGNQADTYGELEFDYTHYLDTNKSKSIDAVWMTSIYEDFGTKNQMSYNFKEQIYLKFNNFLGRKETIWIGNRFCDRRAIHMLDRQWINPGQKGWGMGIENLLDKESEEDVKFAFWFFRNKDVVSYKNSVEDHLYNYNFDARWINKPINDKLNLSMAFNYSLRQKNDKLKYSLVHGLGLFSWLDYKHKNIENTTAVLFRYGANVSTDHWSGISYTENMSNTSYVTSDLSKAYSLEINSNFLYDDFDKFTVNLITMFVVRDYGTSPYNYINDESVYVADRGRMMYWLSAGARGGYYISKYFRLTAEYTHEYVNNRQVDAEGHLNKVTFTPEFSLKKGFYSRPALRPFVNYAFWSDDLRGHIGDKPQGSPYSQKIKGLTYGLQFEIWW